MTPNGASSQPRRRSPRFASRSRRRPVRFQWVISAPTLWAASGHRVNKTTGDVGKWSFAIVSDSAMLEDGKWVLAERGIEAALGLAPLKTE